MSNSTAASSLKERTKQRYNALPCDCSVASKCAHIRCKASDCETVWGHCDVTSMEDREWSISYSCWFYVLVIKMWSESCVLFVGCLNLTVEPNVTSGRYCSKEFVNKSGIELDFSALVRASITFSLKTVNFKAAGPITPPDCYRFDVMVRNWLSPCI
jgi:hypothetical protein